MQHAGADELRVPSGLFLILNLLEQLGKSLLLLLGFNIGHDVDNLEILLGKLSTCWSHVGELNTEGLISRFIISFLDDFDLNHLRGLSLDKSQFASFLHVVHSWSSSVGRLVQLDGLVVDSDDSVGSVLSSDLDFGNLFGSNGFDGLGLLETDLAGLVIVNDSDSSSSVLALKLFHRVWVVELNIEILIWLPVVIVSNLN